MHVVEPNGAKMAVLLLIHGHRHLCEDVRRSCLRNKVRDCSCQ